MRKIGTTLVGLALALTVGCGGGGGSGGEGGGGAGGGTSGGEYAGPIASTDTAHGQERYAARCGTCHESGSAPDLANIGWTPEQLRRQIREGSGGMNAIPPARLSDEDMEAVLAYLVTTGAAASEGGAAPAAE